MKAVEVLEDGVGLELTAVIGDADAAGVAEGFLSFSAQFMTLV